MTSTPNVTHNTQLQKFVGLIGNDRAPFAVTGRKFDKVYVSGEVRYFIARTDVGTDVKEGDIFGAKSKQAPNKRWYFGNLANIEKWDWSGKHGVPVTDKSVLATKGYGEYVHYKKVTP